MLSHAISSEVTSPNLVDDHCMSSQSLISKLSVVAVVTNSLLKNLPSMLLESVLISYVVLCVTYNTAHTHTHTHTQHSFFEGSYLNYLSGYMNFSYI